jgi:hypothetical protein
LVPGRQAGAGELALLNVLSRRVAPDAAPATPFRRCEWRRLRTGFTTPRAFWVLLVIGCGCGCCYWGRVCRVSSQSQGLARGCGLLQPAGQWAAAAGSGQQQLPPTPFFGGVESSCLYKKRPFGVITKYQGSRSSKRNPITCSGAPSARVLLVRAHLLLVAYCLLQLKHGLDEAARGAKSHRKNCNKERTDFSIQATLYPDSFRSSLNRAGQSTVDRVDYRHRLPVGFPVSTMPPPDCTCVAGHASNFFRPAL